MSNHIGKSICQNPFEWCLVIIVITICLTTATVTLRNQPQSLCFVEAVPIEK